MSDALAFLRDGESRILDELSAFARIPSVSTDPAYAAHIPTAVAFVAEQLRSAGLEHVEILPGDGHPAVYADWLHAGEAPTILTYGHYDVQPPDPVSAWTTPPFEPTLRDGRLYGRGTTDNKGPMLIPIKVAEAFMRTAGRLPVNVKFIIEGEEEIGSRTLGETLARERVRLTADFVLSADGARWRVDLPAVNVASRGIAVLEASVTTAAKDLHSGRYGGTVANPLHLLARLVASLHDSEGRVAVAGFYDGVREPSAAERAAIAAVPFDEAAYIALTGASVLVGERGYTTLERQWVRPTLDLNGMWGGYQGAGSKTSIPHVAHAKISCRLVPGQEPERIRIGATLPVSEMFKRILGIDTMLFSFSTSDEDFHAPNEFFRVQSLRDGLAAWTRYWEILGTQKAGLYARFRSAGGAG
jgi:acetylornithine deacetylase/succinyl-diaminopimelate desuccinylase-like protein